MKYFQYYDNFPCILNRFITNSYDARRRRLPFVLYYALPLRFLFFFLHPERSHGLVPGNNPMVLLAGWAFLRVSLYILRDGFSFLPFNGNTLLTFLMIHLMENRNDLFEFRSTGIFHNTMKYFSRSKTFVRIISSWCLQSPTKILRLTRNFTGK